MYLAARTHSQHRSSQSFAGTLPGDIFFFTLLDSVAGRLFGVLRYPRIWKLSLPELESIGALETVAFAPNH
jgi:hypothetical protein